MRLRSNLEVGSSPWIMRRAQWRALGICEDDLDKPKIAIVNSSSELAICFRHLDGIVPVLKEAIREAGGIGFEVRTVAPADNVTSAGRAGQYILPSRDLVASDIEAIVEGAQLDGMVCLASCDKTTPGQLMAAARLDLPSLIVACGYQSAGRYGNERFDVGDLFAAAGRYAAGELDLDEVRAMTEVAITSPGVCTGMATANTMHALAEVLGLALSSTTPVAAGSDAMWAAVRAAGRRIVELVAEGTTPRSILAPGSFSNAAAFVLAVGGSINAIKHLQAIAHEAEIEVDCWGLFEELGEKVPLLVGVRPGGPHPIESLEAAGGTRAVLKQLEPLLDLDASTADGVRLGALLEPVQVADEEIVRPLSSPFAPRSTIVVLRGSLAPEGAVIKLAPGDQGRRRIEGEAKVLRSRAEALEAIRAGEVRPGQVLVLCGVGPRGGPGMAFTSAVVFALEGAGLGAEVALITDGQISGLVNRGIVVGEVAPEAARGGPIGLVRDGDWIVVDLARRAVELVVEPSKLAERAEHLELAPPVPRGLLGVYGATVGGAGDGLALDGANASPT
jgi:dihydroxy-acid dehydratase